MAKFHVFLTDYERDREIPSSEAIERTLEEVLDEFDRLSDVESSFLGLYPPGGGVAQFMYNDEVSLTIDVPQPERRESLTRLASFDECRRIIVDLGKGSRPEDISGLQSVGW